MTQEGKSTKGEYKTPIQLILFGSPGTGKSHKVEKNIAKGLGVEAPEIIKTVFHPEYTYGDFMGKLMPLTDNSGKVTYRYYPGHFMRALALALKHYYGTREAKKEVLLVIDEINRGNSAAIFGTAFQLLDRDEDGWSSYAVNISDMEKAALLKEMEAETTIKGHDEKATWKLGGVELSSISDFLANGKIKLPPNLSIIGTMNTSDESIYYMDSAFKRRWSWEYVPVKPDVEEHLKDVIIEDTEEKWVDFIDKLNHFITSQHESIRKVEDKQIGYYFIRAKENIILKSDIKNKLMFFLWDTVFTRGKKPLKELLGEKELITFGDFSCQGDDFIKNIAKLTLAP